MLPFSSYLGFKWNCNKNLKLLKGFIRQFGISNEYTNNVFIWKSSFCDFLKVLLKTLKMQRIVCIIKKSYNLNYYLTWTVLYDVHFRKIKRKDPLKFSKRSNPNSKALFSITFVEIYNAINSLNIEKSFGVLNFWNHRDFWKLRFYDHATFDAFIQCSLHLFNVHLYVSKTE